MRQGHYILNEDNIAIPVDVLTWARWFEANQERRVVTRTMFPNGVVVSTVFLGTDHQWSASGPRHIFETLVFGGPHDQAMARYATWAQAEAGHAAMVQRVREPVTA